MDTFDLATVWISRKSDPDSPRECVLAWDGWSIEENWEGWREAVDKALASLGDDLDQYRFINLRVPAITLTEAFSNRVAVVEGSSLLDDPRSL